MAEKQKRQEERHFYSLFDELEYYQKSNVRIGIGDIHCCREIKIKHVGKEFIIFEDIERGEGGVRELIHFANLKLVFLP